jgi:hypothetical protein
MNILLPAGYVCVHEKKGKEERKKERRKKILSMI